MRGERTCFPWICGVSDSDPVLPGRGACPSPTSWLRSHRHKDPRECVLFHLYWGRKSAQVRAISCSYSLQLQKQRALPREVAQRDQTAGREDSQWNCRGTRLFKGQMEEEVLANYREQLPAGESSLEEAKGGEAGSQRRATVSRDK